MDAFRKIKELENIDGLNTSRRDALYGYDVTSQKEQNNAKPWRSNPHYFKRVRISAVALVKMVMHARSGGSLEVMGLMQGSIQGDSFIVTDAFRLPVEGTETRVNAQDDANEYMVSYLQRARDSGQMDNVVGWYHSHPGYGCWLSGIDVNTQHTQQSFQDPFLAVVIDPDRTVSAGKVEIGAFRTYPETYTPESNAENDGFQSVPLSKAEDFGAYSNRYYALEVQHFKSSLDTKLLEILWNKYWVGTLSSNPLIANLEYSTKQIQDLALKIRRAEKSQVEDAKRAQGPAGLGGRMSNSKDDQMESMLQSSQKILAEEEAGLLAGGMRELLFTGLLNDDLS